MSELSRTEPVWVSKWVVVVQDRAFGVFANQGEAQPWIVGNRVDGQVMHLTDPDKGS
jgi:hypothetical protein